MNKTSIKNYAIWARNELISRVSQKAYEYGVEKDNIIPYNADSVDGRLLSNEEKKKRQELINEVNHKGYDQVIEEVAYTWFNRFIALRFMEVNNYLPNKVRLFTNENNEFKPQIIEEALHLEIPGLDKDKVIELKSSNNEEELYKELLLATCNDMHNYLPGMFKTIDDYMTLLFPSNLLREESVLGRLITDIEEDSWNDQVQIIGWLYQYYIAERHDKVIDALSKGAIKKEDIPAATQLFTTDWVVKYMVDNSLGRYWIERHPASSLKASLDYYVQSDDDELLNNFCSVKPEDITFIDPCMGSGHILVYAFDVLMKIYTSEGWTEKDAAISILKNNIYGLDIDERAYQLSYFAVMMKARQYNRKVLQNNIIPNVACLNETNGTNIPSLEKFGEIKPLAEQLIDDFTYAKELGSLIEVSLSCDELNNLELKVNEITTKQYSNLLDEADSAAIKQFFLPLLNQAKILNKKYTAVVTNPPYLSKMDGKLKEYVFEYYKEYSSDLFAVFMKRNFGFAIDDGYTSFMTPFVWMFIKSYEQLRSFIIKSKNISTLIQMEYSAYEEATVPICTFVLSNSRINKIGIYFRLSSFVGGMDVQNKKVIEALNNPNCGYIYKSDINDFLKIPGYPIAYWANNKFRECFSKEKFENVAEVITGMTIGDNNKYLRLWPEVNYQKIAIGRKSIDEVDVNKTNWIPYSKGGPRRNWYGNYDYIVNWSKKDHFNRAKTTMQHLYLRPALTWPFITSGDFSARILPQGFLWDVAGSPCFFDDELLSKAALSLLCSKVANYILKVINPTINVQSIDIARIPFIIPDNTKEKCIEIANDSLSISERDWNSFETSWDFTRHPLVRGYKTIKESYEEWEKECTDRFNQLKANEEELNRIFIDIYGLQDELTPEVEDKDITVRKADKEREIKSLISYGVGCMFGRYSLDIEGLAYAGGEWDNSKYQSYIPDKDDIIPICDDEYFKDDIVGRFIEFIKVAYGEDTLEENLQYIAETLGGRGSSREVIRNYFINDFFKDHCNTYQVTGSGKRPIYWQFDSGKKNGFKALVYIHRYTPDLIARMRTSYVHEQQSRYSNQISMIEKQIETASSTSERVKLEKELKRIKEQAEEIRVYEEKVHHWADKMEPMDLDAGVKVNYAKFQELLTKIK